MKLFLFGVTGNAGQAILQRLCHAVITVTLAAARQTAFSSGWQGQRGDGRCSTRSHVEGLIRP